MRLRESAPVVLGPLALLAALSSSVSSLGCERREPPGALSPEMPVRTTVRVAFAQVDGSDSTEERGTVEPGTLADSLPFRPSGLKLASIAWRTWVYTDVGPRRTRYGYLRAGAVVDARGPAIENAGCAGGWYRINPRGFVCLGRGATLDLEHPVVEESATRPKRGEGLPYLYALSESPPPHLYFRLPTREQMIEIEGERVMDRAANWIERAKHNGLRELIGEPWPVPEFLKDGQSLTKPYGVEKPLRRQTHAGRANPDSGFALQGTIQSEGREFALTTELDLVALDRIEVVRPSELEGLRADDGESVLPVAFVDSHYATVWKLTEGESMKPHAEVKKRHGFVLTGESRTGGMLETTDETWIAKSAVKIIEPRTQFPSFATGDRKWIDVSIKNQTLVAYEGRRPVFATLISSGRGGMGDPEKDHATIRGTFMIHHKAVSSTMDGDEDRADSYSLLDVPFVQYFHKGFALHGTYWHDDFGRVRSHGCVNLAPKDAAWLFEWTDPQVPVDWHATINKERGTVVHVRP